MKRMVTVIIVGWLCAALLGAAVTAAQRPDAVDAEFAEKKRGTLEPGKLADLAVLSQNILEIPAEALPATEAVLTMVGGKIISGDRTIEIA